MRNLLLLAAFAFFTCTISAQSDVPSSNDVVKTEKVCAKTGKTCSDSCVNKKTKTCCEGKSDSAKKDSCSNNGQKKSCAKDGKKSSCCAKTSEKTKDTKTKDVKKTGNKAVSMSK
ncbi:MAG: hypothetical protein CL850_00725 [Crocinitomicaceae bacterium]|nr:hypothetical protein [Crocinitomicaceae bacterium]